MKKASNKSRLSRRGFLLASASSVAASVFASSVPKIANAMGQFPAHEQFMRVSNLLIDHELDRDVGARIVVHASAARGDIEERLRRIETVAASKNAKVVEDFFDDLNESEKELALWMILAWYSGSSSSKGDAEVFTYEKALTFKTTSDVVGIPSYGLTGPNLWDRIPSADLIDMPKF